MCAFFHYPLEASVFFSAKWASYDFGFHFSPRFLCGHFILRTLAGVWGIQVLSLFALKCLLKRANLRAEPFLTGGWSGYFRHGKGSRDTCCVSVTIFSTRLHQRVWPRSWRAQHGRVFTPLLQGERSVPRGGDTSGGGNQSVQSHRGPWGDLWWCREARMSGMKVSAAEEQHRWVLARHPLSLGSPGHN